MKYENVCVKKLVFIRTSQVLSVANHIHVLLVFEFSIVTVTYPSDLTEMFFNLVNFFLWVNFRPKLFLSLNFLILIGDDEIGEKVNSRKTQLNYYERWKRQSKTDV